MTDNEKGDTITGYLKKLRSVNPAWLPKFVMADNCNAEFNAFLNAFPFDRGMLMMLF